MKHSFSFLQNPLPANFRITLLTLCSLEFYKSYKRHRPIDREQQKNKGYGCSIKGRESPSAYWHGGRLNESILDSQGLCFKNNSINPCLLYHNISIQVLPTHGLSIIVIILLFLTATSIDLSLVNQKTLVNSFISSNGTTLTISDYFISNSISSNLTAFWCKHPHLSAKHFVYMIIRCFLVAQNDWF